MANAAVDIDVHRNGKSVTQRALSACELASRVTKFEFRDGVNGPQISPMKYSITKATLLRGESMRGRIVDRVKQPQTPDPRF